MNLLVQPVALAAENSVPVLHAERRAGEDVMLGDGQIEDLIGFEKGREDRPAFQHHAAHLHFAEEFRIGQNNLGVLGEGSGLNAGAMEATAGLVAAYISDNDALGSGLPALAHHFGCCSWEGRTRERSSDIGADEFTTNAPPHIANMRLAGMSVVIDFTTFLGESYDVLRARALSGGAWESFATSFPGAEDALPPRLFK